MTQKGVLAVVSGFSGAGKGTLMKELLDQSYRLVLGSFSRKKQREILEAAKAKAGEISCCGTSFPG